MIPFWVPDPTGEGAGEGEWSADERDREQRADEGPGPQPDLAAVGGGHLDNGTDPVAAREERGRLAQGPRPQLRPVEPRDGAIEPRQSPGPAPVG